MQSDPDKSDVGGGLLCPFIQSCFRPPYTDRKGVEDRSGARVASMSLWRGWMYESVPPTSTDFMGAAMFKRSGRIWHVSP